jgi:DNA polymerase III delta prime subunit
MENALDIIIKLSEGDMRKSINLIQAINTVFTKKDKIVQNDVLKQIGYPLVEDKDNIINMILNKKISLEDTIKRIEHFKLQFGLTTADILREISNAIVKKITLKNMVSYSKILDKLGDVEVFMSISYNDTVLLGSIISIIKNNI